MRNLIVVAIVSALIGAALGHWATARTSTSARVDASGVGISPSDIMKSSGPLPIETFDDLM
jgi:hypothetical protein